MTTTTWDAVGGNPAPGDPTLIRQTAAGFRSVDDRVRTVADRLRALSSGLGRQVWTGPAADAFAAVVITGLEAVAADMAAKHGAAATAMTDFANALDHTQEEAQRVATAAESAIQDRNAAAQALRAAAADAAAAVAARNQAKDRIAEAHALESSAAADPAYLAQLKQYEQEMLRLFSAALSREDEANHRQAAARGAVGQAQADLVRAQDQAQATRVEHGDARQVAVARLHDDACHIAGVWQGLKIVDTVGGVIDALDKFRRAGYVQNAYSKLDHLAFDLAKKLGGPGFEDFFHYKGSPVLKLLGKAKWIGKLADSRLLKVLGPIGYVIDGVDVYNDATDLKTHLGEHDYLGATTDGMDIAGTGLKDAGMLTGNPALYLTGVSVSLASDSISAARDIDVHHLPSLDDIRKYGPSSLKDAVGTIFGDL